MEGRINQKTSRKLFSTIAFITVIILIAGVLTIGYVSNTNMMNGYATQLEGVYQRSVFELITNINDIEVDLSKILISTGIKNKQELYDKVYHNCELASANLSRLPINHQSVKETTKFVNQMGGFSYYCADKLKQGTDISTADYNSTDELHTLCLYIQKILNEFASTYSGNFSILQTAVKYDTETEFDGMFSNMQASTVEYPTLIYDGPFSDSQTKKDIKGLSNNEVTKEVAETKVRDVFKDSEINSFQYEGVTTGTFSTYNFSFKTGRNRQMWVQVEKRDGFILTVSSYSASDVDKLSLTECEAKAEGFAQKLGLSVKSVWSTKILGIAYINLTPISNNAIIYPDMIKVKVSCLDGEIIGWESQSYAYNHVTRTNLTPTITESMARTKISSKLTVVKQKIALIPIEYGSETLCYEYKCTLNDATFYVYIDAKTGDEIQVLKVIDTTNGELLM